MDFLGKILPAYFSYQCPDSFVNKFRKRRGWLLFSLLNQLQSPSVINILDIGGTFHFWQMMGTFDPTKYHITLLNLKAEDVPSDIRGFTSVAGNALKLPYNDKELDIIFSNSVIEHMGSRDGQKCMADEVRRVGKRYFIQTPSKWFPLEPHSRLPLFQFLPKHLRALVIYFWNVNYFPKQPTYEGCLKVSDSTIMLSFKQLKALFPDAIIYKEHFGRVIKSYIAVSGWS